MADGILAWMGALGRDDIALLLAAVALIYAHLAYRASVKGTKQARRAELDSLRLQAKASLTDAQHSFLTLEAKCQANRVEWARYQRRQPPLSTQTVTNSWPVEHEARALLADLKQSFGAVETMTQSQLEGLLQKLQSTSLQITALSGTLEAPPAYH